MTYSDPFIDRLVEYLDARIAGLEKVSPCYPISLNAFREVRNTIRTMMEIKQVETKRVTFEEIAGTLRILREAESSLRAKVKLFLVDRKLPDPDVEHASLDTLLEIVEDWKRIREGN